MNSIAKLLKQTVERVAQKRVRSETQTLRKASTRYRKTIAELGTRLKEMERELAIIRRQLPKAPAGGGEETDNLRFSAKGLQKLREKLGLSATECGILLGVSGRTIGKWESGSSRPKADQLASLAGLRKMGKREVRIRLAEQGRKK
jgi:DNA-binding transcriptional regulator YiaG